MSLPESPSIAAERRQRVLHATRAPMAEQGFLVSMEAVAHLAGCSKQTLYAQFGGKNDLLQDLMNEHLQLTTARLGAAVTQRAPEARRAWPELAVDAFLRAFAPSPRTASC